MMSETLVDTKWQRSQSYNVHFCYFEMARFDKLYHTSEDVPWVEF